MLHLVWRSSPLRLSKSRGGFLLRCLGLISWVCKFDFGFDNAAMSSV